MKYLQEEFVMRSVNYEAPKMVLVNLRNEQAVAADDGPCLGVASGNGGVTQFVYDVPGNGWIAITGMKNCKGEPDELDWKYVPKTEGNPASKDVIDQAIEKGKASMKENKQAFAGAYANNAPSEWS